MDELTMQLIARMMGSPNMGTQPVAKPMDLPSDGSSPYGIGIGGTPPPYGGNSSFTPGINSMMPGKGPSGNWGDLVAALGNMGGNVPNGPSQPGMNPGPWGPMPMPPAGENKFPDQPAPPPVGQPMGPRTNQGKSPDMQYLM